MGAGSAEAEQEPPGGSKYISTNLILAGNRKQVDISTARHTIDVVLENEADLQLPDEIQPKDSIILDATEIAQRYVRPEQDLLAFTNDDLDMIESNYARAYAHLDKIMGASTMEDHKDDLD